MQNVMLDIESMALHPANALILSIGLVEFDPTGEVLKIGERMTLYPDLSEQLSLGRVVEDGTQKFWANQPQAAKDDWLYAPRITLKTAAERIKAFLPDTKRIWANHINFDISNVATLIRQAGESEPWHYRAPFDMPSWLGEREMRFDRVGGDLVIPDLLKSAGVPHTPIYDCIVQSHRVWQHWPKPEPLAHHPV